jgi:hypothetical protein
MIQPSHRTVCSVSPLIFFFFFFSFLLLPFTQGEGKEERGKKKKKKKKRKSERQTTGHPVRVANTHQTNTTRTAKREREPSPSLIPHSYCTAGGQCLKRSHTVLITIHAAAAVVQHTTGWPPGDAAARSLSVICNAFWYPILSHT